MEIAPGVHRVEGVAGSNSVLLVDDQMALVDTGYPGNSDAIVGYIERLGRKPSDLRWIILTHLHGDHSGSATELHERTGASVVTHRAEADPGPDGKLWLRQGNEGEPPPGWYQWFRRLLGQGQVRQFSQGINPATEVHETLEEGDVLPCLGGLRILHTPGHTPGSICPYIERHQMLFLGDSVLNNVDRLSRPLMWDRSRRRQLDASLRRLRSLEIRSACFGHGPPMMENAYEQVRALTDIPYDLPTWMIAFKNWRTLRRFTLSGQRPWEERERRSAFGPSSDGSS